MYCTVDDVQKLRPHHPITVSSRPSIADVEQEIKNRSSQVDGRLAALGFLVPVTSGPISLAYINAAVSYGVACTAEIQQRAAIHEQPDTVPRQHYCELFEQMIAAVEADRNTLPDAPDATGDATSTGGRIESFYTKYPQDDPLTGMRAKLGPTAVPRFEIRREF